MIIMIAGLSGSGKSYFAEKLAVRLNAAYINSDQVRQAVHASGQYSFQDKLVVYKEMVRLTTDFLKDNNVVVLDAIFYRQTMRELIFSWAKKFFVLVIFIELI